MGLLEFLTTTVGIDPGSQNLRIVHKDQIVFNERSELSVDPTTNKVSGYGNGSIHNAPNKIIKPVNTVIGDFHGFEHLLRASLKGTLNERNWFPTNYRMYFSLPISATEVEKRAYRDAGEHAGAREAYMIHQPCCSAIGMGILFEKRNFTLVDFSASKVEITVFANSMPIAEGAVRIGIWKLNKALKNYLYREHKLSISTKEIESLLINLTAVGETHKIGNKSIPKEEIKEVLKPYFIIIEDNILETMEQASNNNQIDKIISNGFFFTGGGSNITWISNKIALNCTVKSRTSTRPLLDNIYGVKEVLKRPEFYKDYVMV